MNVIIYNAGYRVGKKTNFYRLYVYDKDLNSTTKKILASSPQAAIEKCKSMFDEHTHSIDLNRIYVGTSNGNNFLHGYPVAEIVRDERR